MHNINLGVGDSRAYKVEVKSAYANRKIVWRSSDPSVASVSGNGVVTAHIGGGYVVISAQTENYSAQSYLILQILSEEQLAEQVWVELNLIQEYKNRYNNPVSMLSPEFPTYESLELAKLEMQNSILLLQYSLLNNILIKREPLLSATIAQYMIEGLPIGLMDDSHIRFILSEGSPVVDAVFTRLHNQQLMEVLREMAQATVDICSMLPIVGAPADLIQLYQGIVGTDFTGRRLSWVERACNIVSGVFTAVECVGLLKAAILDVRFVNKLSQVADMAGDVKIKAMANAIQEAPSIAKAAQMAGGYHEDVFSVTLLKKGHRIYGGLPGQSEWYTDLASLEASGYSRSKLSQGLQVKPNPVHGYRAQVGVYEVLEDVVVAEGITLANPQFGIGGYHQFFVEQYKKVLKLVEVIDLAE